MGRVIGRKKGNRCYYSIHATYSFISYDTPSNLPSREIFIPMMGCGRGQPVVYKNTHTYTEENGSEKERVRKRGGKEKEIVSKRVNNCSK